MAKSETRKIKSLKREKLKWRNRKHGNSSCESGPLFLFHLLLESSRCELVFLPNARQGKAWCGYCVLGALANIGIAALTIPEAKEAVGELKRKNSFDSEHQ